jgi:hypothetical protein
LSVQAPLAHWTSALQEEPVGLIGWQAACESQYWPFGQGRAALQPDEQCMASEHWLEVQGVCVGAVQAPEPLHTVGAVLTPLEQLAAVHWTVLPGYLHWVASVPSQRLAHIPAPAHACRTVPRGVPLIVAHMPSLPVSAQAWHWPEQRLPQQTLSVQKVLVHSWSAAQAAPVCFWARQALVVASQYMPLPQGWVALQPPEHWLASAHWFEVQLTAALMAQAPARSQNEGGCATPAAQVASAHWTSPPG